MLNRVILIGRLTRDPELRYTTNGKPVVRFTLAVDRQRAPQGERSADFIDIVAWEKLAETVHNYLNKGRLAAVQGRLQVRSYEAKDGQRRRVWEVVADQVSFLDRPQTEGTAADPFLAPDAPPEDGQEDDIPF